MSKLNQSRRREEIEDVVENALKKNTFSGACISFSQNEVFLRERKDYSFGYTTKNQPKNKVNTKTYFDLASLTKPLVTSLSIAVLIEKGKVGLQDNLADCCSWVIPDDKIKIKISHLLSHSSGLPAHRPYYQELGSIPLSEKKRTLRNWIVGEQMCFLPGTSTLYSDLGFMLLGFLVEDLTDTPLDIFWKENVITPLGLQNELFFPKNKRIDTERCAATKNSHRCEDLLTGVVHDYNCRAMGGVGGHAGLFGTAPAVASLCEYILDQSKGRNRHPSYSSSLLINLLERKIDSEWSYGFDSPTKGKSSSGVYFSTKSRGHLGFTGTSFWIDFDRDIVIVVLTNRVHLSNDLSGIRAFRPLIHDTIMKKLR